MQREAPEPPLYWLPGHVHIGSYVAINVCKDVALCVSCNSQGVSITKLFKLILNVTANDNRRWCCECTNKPSSTSAFGTPHHTLNQAPHVRFVVHLGLPVVVPGLCLFGGSTKDDVSRKSTTVLHATVV